MKKLLLFPLLAIILLTGCTKHEFVVKKQIKTRHFDYFELSYHGGWLGKLQFCVDSNHIYFSGNPGADFLDTIKYGILPDSIVKYIDTIVEKITKDTTIKSNHTYCHDCDNISIIIVRGQDTTKQIGRAHV